MFCSVSKRFRWSSSLRAIQQQPFRYNFSELSQTAEIQNMVNNNIDAFVFDCDGVLWTGNNAIPGAVDVIGKLRDAGKKIVFLSNSAVKTPSDLVAKARLMGFSINHEEVMTSGLAAAQLLKSLNLRYGATVYVVGENGLCKTLEEHAGNAISCLVRAEVFPGEEQQISASSKKQFRTFDDFASFVGDDFEESGVQAALDPKGNIEAVVVSRQNDFDYFTIARASALLKYDKHIHFIATNIDEASPSISASLLVPAAGTMVAAVETASGRTAISVGKPSKELGDLVVKKYNLNPERTCMVGDRLNTDVEFGKICGMQTMLVLSGVAQMEDLHPLKTAEKPDYVLLSIADLFLK
jgi:HAD superfamily hydrolase (TIGR01450 family)